MVNKQVYASFSTVTSMAIVQRVNFTIQYKNQYVDIRYFLIIAQHYFTYSALAKSTLVMVKGTTSLRMIPYQQCLLYSRVRPTMVAFTSCKVTQESLNALSI